MSVSLMPHRRDADATEVIMRSILACLLIVFFVRVALAEFPGTHPYRALTYMQETRTDPPQQIHIAKIDLTKPGVQIRVSRGGPDPDGPGEWETTLMQPTRVAERAG